jgi:Na+/proline symporter
VHHALPAAHFTVLGDIGFVQALELAVPTLLLMLGNQSMYQKFFSAKSERDARRAVVGWVIGTVILETVIVALAVTGSALYKTGEIAQRPREILAYSALHGLPAWLGALVMGAIFAKVVSTANNYLFSPATNLVNDIFVRYISPEASNKRILIISRLMVVLLGIFALYQALGTGSVLRAALYAYTVYSAALTPVILAAFYSRRATAWGAVSAIAAGTAVTVFWNWDPGMLSRYLPKGIVSMDAIFPALAAAVLCLVVVSALTKAPSPEQLAQFHGENRMA